MDNLLKVSGNDNLVKDSETGVVLNCNRDDYENYKRKQNAAIQMRNDIQKQNQEISKLKEEMSEIKQLLIAILNK